LSHGGSMLHVCYLFHMTRFFLRNTKHPNLKPPHAIRVYEPHPLNELLHCLTPHNKCALSFFSGSNNNIGKIRGHSVLTAHVQKLFVIRENSTKLFLYIFFEGGSTKAKIRKSCQLCKEMHTWNFPQSESFLLSLFFRSIAEQRVLFVCEGMSIN
jgi:hypothetical protein